MFTHRIGYEQDVYEAEAFLHLINVFGKIEAPGDHVFLTLAEKDRASASLLLKPLAGRPCIALFSGASVPERQWGVASFRGLAERLVHAGFSIVVVGGREDRLNAAEMIAGLDHSLNLAGQCTLAVSAAIISQSALLVSGDSGVLHIGVGLNVPTVSLFGPGIENKWGPRGFRHRVLNKNLDCSPCTKFGYTPDCPIGVECLRRITVDEVFNATVELLGPEGLL